MEAVPSCFLSGLRCQASLRVVGVLGVTPPEYTVRSGGKSTGGRQRSLANCSKSVQTSRVSARGWSCVSLQARVWCALVGRVYVRPALGSTLSAWPQSVSPYTGQVAILGSVADDISPSVRAWCYTLHNQVWVQLGLSIAPMAMHSHYPVITRRLPSPPT